jgi:hypothetical protein
MLRTHRNMFARLAVVALAIGIFAVNGCRDAADVAGPSAMRAASLAFAVNNSVAAIDTDRTFYGPVPFSRTAGAPNSYTSSISTIGYAAPFTLHVRNGDASGILPASSATISLDGVVLMSPADFKKHKVDYSFPVAPNATTSLQVQMAGTDTGFVTIWIDGKEHARFCPAATGDGFGYQTLQQALDTVTPAHTVWVCNGTHVVNEALVTKALTLRAENAGMATLVQPPSAAVGDAILDVTGSGSGKDAFLDLSLRFTQVGMHLHGAFDSVSVIRTSFTGPGTVCGPSPNVGLFAEATTVATAHVGVHRSSFSNSCSGLNAMQPVDFDTYNSSFTTFGEFGLLYYSANSTGQNPSPTGTPIARMGRVIGNTFTNCGVTLGACIAIETIGVDTVSQNHLIMTTGHVADGIFVNGAGEPASLRGLAVLTDNVIQGSARVGPDSASTSWSYVGGIVESPGVAGVADVIQGNRISGAYAGLEVRGASVFAFTDNTVDTAFVGMVFTNVGATLAAHRNDFMNYVIPIATSIGGFVGNLVAPAIAIGSGTCNWWGGVGGPANIVPGTALGVYAPYSTARIAGKSSVNCDPTAAVTTVRACTTTNNSGFPTLPTVQQAYAAIPSGGTVLVCAGTFAVSELTIAKPVTITGEGPGTATIDAGSNNDAFIILHVAANPVNITNLRFTGGLQSQIVVRSSGPKTDGAITNIKHNEFDGPVEVNQLGPAGAVVMTNTDSGVVNVDSNTFIGGDTGANPMQVPGATINVRWNTFTGQTFASVPIANFDVGAMIDVEGNNFIDCATTAQSCVTSNMHVRVVGNTFTVHIAKPVQSAIYAVSATDPALSTITDNVIVGVGHSTNIWTVATTYPFQAAAIGVVGGSANVLRNTVTNAFEGLDVWNGASVTATDNVFTKTFAPFASDGQGLGLLAANWNDVTDYIAAVGNTGALDVTALNIRCNWWGQAGGPSPVSGAIPTSAYTPFATAPMANVSHTACTP